jgi:prophage regulatory protein
MTKKNHENQLFDPNRYYRLPQIVGQKAVTDEQADENRACGKAPRTPRREISPRLPISRASLYLKIQSGAFPPPVKLGPRTSAWRGSDLNAWLDETGGCQ